MKVVCCKCGRELPGVEASVSKLDTILCSDCIDNKTSADNCCRGDKVMYTAKANVPDVALVAANTFLNVGDVYEVEGVKVADATRLKFVGHKYWFRSELFERVCNG